MRLIFLIIKHMLITEENHYVILQFVFFEWLLVRQLQLTRADRGMGCGEFVGMCSVMEQTWPGRAGSILSGFASLVLLLLLPPIIADSRLAQQIGTQLGAWDDREPRLAWITWLGMMVGLGVTGVVVWEEKGKCALCTPRRNQAHLYPSRLIKDN